MLVARVVSLPILIPHGPRITYVRNMSARVLNSFRYRPIIKAVKPRSIVNAADVRFKESLHVPLARVRSVDSGS